MSSVGVALAAFTVYAIGACGTIYVGDSGELVTAVHVLGIPHPTGYPLYVLLGKLWTLAVPFGSIAFRMSLFSAAAAAAAVGVLHALCLRVGLRPVAATFAALVAGFGPSFWGEANVQRVYSLNALFVAIATAAALRWYRERERRWLVLAFALSGLGATNHSFMIVFAAALLAFALLAQPRLIRAPRALALSGLAFGAGLLPYAYLPLRSRANPVLDWGNPETLEAFFDVVSRRDFLDRAWIESPADLGVIALDYATGLGRDLVWVGAGLALVGLLFGWRRGWPVALPLLVMTGNVLSMALHGSRSDLFIWHRYYIPSYVMGAILAGMGCHALLMRIPHRLRFLPLAVPALMVVFGWSRFDRSRYRIADDFSRTLMSTLPPGAHLSASDDNILFVLIYLHFVEEVRPDIDLILQGVGDADLPPLKFDPDTDPLFLTHYPNWDVEGLRIVPVGLTFQTVRSGRAPPSANVPKNALGGEHDPRVPKDYLTRNLIGHFHYMMGVSFENRDWPRAAEEFDKARNAAPDNDVLFYNLGLIYRRNGLFDEALAAFERSEDINPRHIASSNRPARASDRARELVSELERLRAIESSLSDAIEAAPGTAAYHAQLAALLGSRGETVAARGHRRRAAEARGQ